MGFLCRCVRRIVELAVVFLVIAYMPGLPPEGSFTTNSISTPKPLEGPYSLNNFLNNADHLYVDKVHGPECFAEWNGELYTSVHGGEVVKLLPNGQIKPVVKIGQPCDGVWQEQKCGRPLGIEFDKNGILYVVDAYYGIWKVNLANGQKQLLVSPTVEIEGRVPKTLNSIALASNGDFYWTDSTSDVKLSEGVFAMLLDGTGRLFHYDAAKNKSRVLLDGLWFANGVALSPGEDFVIVCETARSQIRRYYLKGSKKGTDDIFIDNLPGVPDNLKAYPNDLLAPLVAPRDDKHPVIFQSIAPHPILRRFIARLLYLIKLPFIGAQKVMPHYVFERAAHWIGHFESTKALVPKRTTILRLDWGGNVLEAWHNIDSTLSSISEVHIYKNQLYLGSPYNNYIGRVPIPGVSMESVRLESAKPKVETPKPTQKPQQTPPPTTAKTTQQPKTPPPTEKSTQPPKQAETKPTQPPKTQPPTQKTKPTEKPVKKETLKEQPKVKVETKEKPVVEEIPSDTRPPQKENIKIIKKEGPSEIPNPETLKQPTKPTKQPAKNVHAKNEL